MPIVRIDMFEGRDRKTKQELVKSITSEMVRITGCSEASVHVVINNVAKEDWGLGGELAAIKFPD
ncbi:2-hydroxymuconate tautomerase family protein [Sneathiella chungangensis]|uniref:Tautomerase n=1 Tax=Sneathiella chungangensis TaxID=1418234 RepID=A0A845MN05_9PROT|nr:2-hydroxymuconate tautomerase [Sneathiella chungangensis]MZR24276.1 2-hydroxymuconate tautomerase family protein [Sneathiella chungangensis]